MTDIVSLSLLAALFSLDVTLFGQFMFSRPIVCGPVFGYLLGDIKSGLWVGMIVELFWAGTIPMGAAIPTDTTAVTILATVCSLRALPGQETAVILAIALAIPAGVLFRQFDIWMRLLNVRIVHWIERGVAVGLEQRISQGIHLGLLLFLIKSFLFYVTIISLGVWLVGRVHPRLPDSVMMGFTLAWKALPVAGLAMVLVSYRRHKFPCFK